MKILSIEDDDNTVLLTKTALRIGEIPLQASDFQTCDNLHDAGNIANWFQPDVIILDLGLTNSKSGLVSLPAETVQASRRLCQLFSVVVLTGYDDVQFWRTMISHGASDYLFKGAFLAKGREFFFAHAINTAYYRTLARAAE